MDELYTAHPFNGSRQMSRHLEREGWRAGRRRVRRLMRTMGLAALYCRPRCSEPHPGHRIYPYLLRNLAVGWTDQELWRSMPGAGSEKGPYVGRAHEKA